MPPTATHGRSPSGGRGHGGRGKGREKARSHHGGQRSHHVSPTMRATKFHGSCDALKEYIFDCSDHRQADQFANTLKRILEYVGAEYKNGGDIHSSVVNETKFTVLIPTAPTVVDPANPTAQEQVQIRL